MEKVFSFIGGRKMFFAILLFISSTIFLLIGQAEFRDWSDFVMWIFGIYAVGNTGEHLSNIRKK